TPTTEHRLRGVLRDGWDGQPPVAVSALLDDRVVGSGYLWSSTHDKLTSAWFGISMHHRPTGGAGSGAGCWTGCAARALDMGRSLVGMSGWEAEATHGFASAHGFEARLTEVIRRQVL